MKTIISGTKTVKNSKLLMEAVEESKFEISEVVTGSNFGADYLATRYAEDNKIPLKIFPSYQDSYGHSAGPIRNKEMVEYADSLIIIIDNESRETKNLIESAQKKGIPVSIKYINRDYFSLDDFI